MLELPQTPCQPVEVNCSCCRCCNCPLSALSAVRVVASTRLALASLRSGLRSVSRHGAHGNSVKDGVEQSAADMDVVCVFVWNRSIPRAPCGSPHSADISSSRCLRLRLRLCRSSSNRVDDILVHTPEHAYTTLLPLKDVRGRGRERASTPRQVGAPVGFLWGFLLSVAKWEGDVIMLLLLANLLETESYVWQSSALQAGGRGRD